MVTPGRATAIVMPRHPPLPGSDVALLKMHERNVAAWWPAHRRLPGEMAGRWPRWGLGTTVLEALSPEQGHLPEGL